jgi:hypothetical protein
LITATKFLKEMSKGYCHPKLFECNDGKRYVVKLMSNPQGLRALPNELIACRLGKLLNLPIAPGRIVYLTNDLIKNNPELTQQRVQPGPHFGSIYIENAREPSRRNIKKCVNLHQGVDMIVFDHWIQNDDRRIDNIILSPGDKSKFYMIDHEGCFCGSGWYDKALKRNRSVVKPYWSLIYKRFAPYIVLSYKTFDEPLKRLESLSFSNIRKAMDNIPLKWQLETKEINLLADYLEKRKWLVRSTILKLINRVKARRSKLGLLAAERK